MRITDRITLNLSGDNRLVRVQAKQGDMGSRFLEIGFEHDGVPYPVPEGVTARAEFFRPDKTFVMNDETVRGGLVIAQLTQQMLTVAGEATCEVQLCEGDTVLSSAVFTVMVNPSAAPVESIESSDEYSTFANALQKVDTINNEAAKSAAEALKSLEAAKAEADKSKEQAGISLEAAKALNTAGIDFRVLDFFDAVEELDGVANPSIGDAYGVGKSPTTIYIWNGQDWKPGTVIETDLKGYAKGDDEGSAENANALGQIPAENYLPELLDTLAVPASTPQAYTSTRPCVLRPSFRGRTVQEGTPSPENPVPVRGVLNP